LGRKDHALVVVAEGAGQDLLGISGDKDASGNAKLDYVDHQISLANDAKSAIGRSVVVHAKPDDLKTQPSGDAGGRIACGVIGWAKPQ